MRFSYWADAAQPVDQIVASARHVEATGWDGVWIADHFLPTIGAMDGPMHECWGVLGVLAGAVERVRLGSLVCGNTYRHPALLAKMATSVDHASHGRVVLGLGAGWEEREHACYGFDFGTVRSRLDRLEEAAAVITSLRDEATTTFEGAHYRLQDAPLEPKPVGPLPLLIGGGGERRTLRIAASFAQEWNVWGTPELLAHKGAVLDARCEEVGRDPAGIQRSTQALLFLGEDPGRLEPFRDLDLGRPTIVGTPDEVVEIVAAYRDAGVDELIVPDFTLGEPARRHDLLDLFVERVAPSFR